MTQQTIDCGHTMEPLSYQNRSDVGSSYVCHDNSKALLWCNEPIFT
jgi:hypothetical protein